MPLGITEQENELIELLVLKGTRDRKALLVAISIEARTRGVTGKLIEFIKKNDSVDIEKIVDFLWPVSEKRTDKDISNIVC